MILDHIVGRRTEMSETKIVEYLRQLCDGLEYIHEKSVRVDVAKVWGI